MHECNAQTLILPPFGPKRWDVTTAYRIELLIIIVSPCPTRDRGRCRHDPLLSSIPTMIPACRLQTSPHHSLLPY
jgi:hypothetical protein